MAEERGGVTADELARSAGVLGVSAAIALGLTILWHMSVAHLYGTAAELDAFWIALALPKAIADSFHLGILTLLFVLVFNLPELAGEEAQRCRVASTVLNLVLVLTLAGMAAMAVAAPALVDWMGPGLDEGLRQRAAAILRTLSLYLVPTALCGALAGSLHASRRFLPFALARALGLAVQIAVLHLLARRMGVGALVLATALGAVAMLLVLVPACRGGGFRYVPVFELRGALSLGVLKFMGSLACISVFDRVNQITDRFFASRLGPGSVAALEFGWRFEIPISHIVGFSVALPAFAIMALQASERRLPELRGTLVTSSRLLALLVVPMVGFLVVLREPLTWLWFRRGAFSDEAAATVASLIPFLAVVFLCKAFAPMVSFGFLSIHRSRLLLGVLVAEAAANVALNAALAPRFGLRGVAAATALATLGANGTLWVLLLRELGEASPGSVLAGLSRVAVAGALATALLLGAAWGGISAVLTGEGPWLALQVAGTGLAFGLVYLLVCRALGLVEFRRSGGLPALRLTLGGEVGSHGA